MRARNADFGLWIESQSAIRNPTQSAFCNAMISLTCTNCQTTLSIDDAFAGGVCRCQHCGTIQTVPSRRKAGAATATAEKPPATKTLYRNDREPAASSNGSGSLDEPADAAHSSG